MLCSTRTAWLLVVSLACFRCSPSGGPDVITVDIPGQDVSNDLFQVLDGNPVPDAAVDVTPASLPGRWRLVGWTSNGVAGSVSYTDVDPTMSETGTRVDGTLNLASDHLAFSSCIVTDGHIAINSAVADPTVASSVFGLVKQGTLGNASFTSSDGATFAFRTNVDGTISTMLPLPNVGMVALTFASGARIPALGSVSTQAFAVQLQPGMADTLVAPRAALAWDLPGGGGIEAMDDAPLRFLPTGTAAYRVASGAPPTDAWLTVGDTQVAVAYVIVYDDLDGDGIYVAGPGGGGDGGVDAGSFEGGMDAGVSDRLRGISPVAVAIRSGPGASSAWTTSPFRELLPGTQLTLVRTDPSATNGLSLGLLDTTNPLPPDVPIAPHIDVVPYDVVR